MNYQNYPAFSQMKSDISATRYINIDENKSNNCPPPFYVRESRANQFTPKISRTPNISQQRTSNSSTEWKLIFIYLISIIACICFIVRFTLHGAYSYSILTNDLLFLTLFLLFTIIIK